MARRRTVANIVTEAKHYDPLFVPRIIAGLFAAQPEFMKLENYIYRVDPYEGEIGIFGGRRIVVSKMVRR